MFDNVIKTFGETLGLAPLLVERVLWSAMLVMSVVAGRWLLVRTVTRRLEDPADQYRWRKTATYTSAAVLGFCLWRLWLGDTIAIGTFAGLLGAGLVVALKDPLTGLAGWGFALWRRPFVVGDRIQIGSFAGDVVDLRLFQFTLLEIGNWVDGDQCTGRLVHVPNGKIFTEALANYTRAFKYIWVEVPVLVTLESDWRRAKAILQEIAANQCGSYIEDARSQIVSAARRYVLTTASTQPTVFVTTQASGILLTMRFVADPRERRATTAAVWEQVLTRLAEQPAISLAYPTTRFYVDRIHDQPGQSAIDDRSKSTRLE